jgi:hypothetical protein
VSCSTWRSLGIFSRNDRNVVKICSIFHSTPIGNKFPAQYILTVVTAHFKCKCVAQTSFLPFSNKKVAGFLAIQCL